MSSFRLEACGGLHRSRRASGLLLLVLVAGGCLSFPDEGRYACDPESGEDCQAPSEPGSDAGPDPGLDDGGGPAPVSGLAGVRHLVDGGASFSPRDLSRTVVGAFFPLDDGGYTYHPGVGRGDGTFEVAGVPAGDFYLRDGQRYLLTGERTLDLVSEDQGRPKPPANPNPATTLTFQVTGLAPWETGDELELSAFEAGALVTGMKTWIGPDVAATATASTPFAFDALGIQPLDHALGDVVSLVQQETRTVSPGVVYRAATRQLELGTFRVAAGQSSVFAGAMQALPESTLGLDWRRSAFAQMEAAVHPNATYSDDLLVVNALPGVRGYYSGAPTLLQMYLKPGTADERFTLPYGNPFPLAQGVFARAYTFFLQQFEATRPSGDPVAFSLFFSAYHMDLLAPFVAQEVTPQVTPPRAVRLNGEDAQVNRTGVGLQPRITWTPPEVGASGVVYILLLSRVTVADTGTPTSSVMATFTTTRTELSFPPDLLQPGGQYYLELQALRMPNRDRRHPYVESFPKSLAPTLSGIFRP